MEMILSTLLIHIERTPQQMHCFSMCTCTLLKIPVSIVTLIDYYSLCPTFCLFLTLVGNCLVNVIIPQKYIKIRSRVIFSWLRVNKSDSIKGLQNSAEDYLISVFFSAKWQDTLQASTVSTNTWGNEQHSRQGIGHTRQSMGNTTWLITLLWHP